jgi:hypothetical protein
MVNKNQSGITGKLLYEEHLMSIIGKMQEWRIDSREAREAKNKILDFISGLRFSALLIYTIREILSGTNLEANWGHLLDKDNNFCSPECDIIIHRNGHVARWNGSEKPIMDFRFIKQQDAVVVVSCKSHIASGDVDKGYCPSMKPFVSKVWLFAECCGPRSGESIKRKALKSGYDNFWYLYSWSEKTSPQTNKEGWMNFVEELKKLR